MQKKHRKVVQYRPEIKPMKPVSKLLRIKVKRLKIWKAVVLIIIGIILLLILANSREQQMGEDYVRIERDIDYSAAGVIHENLTIQTTTKSGIIMIQEPNQPTLTAVTGNIPTGNAYYTEEDLVLCAITLTGEAGGVSSLTEQSGVVWTILNRVDDERFPNTIKGVITQKGQFDGYRANGKYYEQCYNLAKDILDRWSLEQVGFSGVEVGRSLPTDYLYFTGDGSHNYFAKTENGKPYIWGAMLISPYKN